MKKRWYKIEDNQKERIQQRVECDEDKRAECDGERLQERQQEGEIVQYRMTERDNGELSERTFSFALMKTSTA